MTSKEFLVWIEFSDIPRDLSDLTYKVDNLIISNQYFIHTNSFNQLDYLIIDGYI